MRKKKRVITFVEKLRLIKGAGIENIKTPNMPVYEIEKIKSLEERIQTILGIFEKHKKNPLNMIYFVMYDIEDDRIRNHIAKFLIRKGCVRVQKSIFLADTNREVFNEIYTTLKEVQEVYDNNDSIFLVPVSTDQLRAMKIIGENIDFDLVLSNKNTLIF